jgi:hypothetical protein
LSSNRVRNPNFESMKTIRIRMINGFSHMTTD